MDSTTSYPLEGRYRVEVGYVGYSQFVFMSTEPVSPSGVSKVVRVLGSEAASSRLETSSLQLAYLCRLVLVLGCQDQDGDHERHIFDCHCVATEFLDNQSLVRFMS